MSRKVIFLAPDVALLLSGYHNDNGVITGYVVNGAWDFKFAHGQCFAHDDGGGVRRSWPAEIVREVDVPDDMGADYNEIIAWASCHRR